MVKTWCAYGKTESSCELFMIYHFTFFQKENTGMQCHWCCALQSANCRSRVEDWRSGGQRGSGSLPAGGGDGGSLLASWAAVAA